MKSTKVREFKQKNRKRPIDITDIAISKVPRTRIYGFTPEQNKVIQEEHIKLLKLAQHLNKENKSNKMEVGILIDTHTWEDWVINGEKECEVEMKNNPLALQVLTTMPKNRLMFMHNHPSTGTFSGEDFKTFCNNDSLYMMTVIGNDASVYILIKNSNFNMEYALLSYGELSIKYMKQGHIKDNGTLAIKHILENANNYGLTYKKGRSKI